MLSLDIMIKINDYDNIHFIYTNVRCHDKINDHVRQFKIAYISYTQMYVEMIKNINSLEQSIMTTYILLNTIHKYYNFFNDQVTQLVTTYIPHTQMYVVMIKNINSPEQSIMTTYILFNKMYKYYDKYY